MPNPFADEELIARLPLPLAQLYRRAHNANSALGSHLASYYLWEVALKLLGSVVMVHYAQAPEPDPKLAERLQNLARPALGHWWEFLRRLLPILAERPDSTFLPLRDLILGRSRIDLPRLAGLDAALLNRLEDKPSSRSTVRLAELLNRIISFRNDEVGHGAVGQLDGDYYQRMGAALRAGFAELMGKLDPLAGERLIYVAEVRQVGGVWLASRYELIGESPRRLPSLEWARTEAGEIPDGDQVYLEGSTTGKVKAALLPLHPLVLFDAEAAETLFLNSQRTRKRAEYLSYTSGKVVDRAELDGVRCEFLGRLLGAMVSPPELAEWAAHSQTEDPPGPARETSPRRTLGEFELLSELGRGGMGIVYRAWQPSLGRQVALKKLQHTGNQKAEARFQREILALGKVDHPHLVKTFTSGSDGDEWFYAMELVEGAPLASVCQRLQSQSSSVSELNLRTWREALSTVYAEARKSEKPLNISGSNGPPSTRPGSPEVTFDPVVMPAERNYVRHVAHLMAQVAEAAHALHEHGIIHRDIKPGNVLVTADGAKAVLMDLGLAQLIDDEEGRLTRTRQFVGTLRYASPQQVLAVAKLDRRSDVYSLGATLYELLALRPLFGANEEMATPELMEKIQRAEPEALRRLHPGLPRDLATIVHKCLEKAPDKRYPTAHALTEDLRRYLRGEPIQARPVGPAERVLKWMRRRPMVAALLISVAVVTAMGIGAFAWAFARSLEARDVAEKRKETAERAFKQSEKDRKQAEEERNKAEREAKKATRIAQVLTEMFEAADPLGINGIPALKLRVGETLTAREILERGAAKVLRDLNEEPETQAQLLDMIGNVFLTLGLTDQARAFLEKALVRRRQALPADHPDLAATLHSLAFFHHMTGNYDSAEQFYREALVTRRKHEATAPIALSNTLINLGWLLADLEDFVAAKEMFKGAIELRLRHLPPDHRDLAIARVGLAGMHLAEAEYFDAFKAYSQAMATLRKIEEGKGLIESIDLFQKGVLGRQLPIILRPLVGLKNDQEVERCFEQSLQLAREELGDPKTHAYIALVLHELAFTLQKHGKEEAAEQYYRQCLDKVRGYGLQHPKVAILLVHYCPLLQRRGKREEAEKLLQEALQARRMHCRPDHYAIADVLVIQAFLQPERASVRRQLLLEALAIYCKSPYAPGKFDLNCVELLSNSLPAPEIYSMGIELARAAMRKADPAGKRARYQDMAMYALLRARENGFTDIARLQRDRDLDALRGRPDFRKLIADADSSRAR